jgi:hypothetical protein
VCVAVCIVCTCPAASCAVKVSCGRTCRVFGQHPALVGRSRQASVTATHALLSASFGVEICLQNGQQCCTVALHCAALLSGRCLPGSVCYCGQPAE